MIEEEREEQAAIIAAMVGVTFTHVERKDDELRFRDGRGRTITFNHDQSCCEKVYIEDVCGDTLDLLGEPILLAEEVSNYIGPELQPDEYGSVPDSHTWTFYRFATVRGTVTVRWLGTSNGYYSERVSVSRDGIWSTP